MQISGGRFGHVGVSVFTARSSARGPVLIAALCLCLLFAAGTSAQQHGAAKIGDSSKAKITEFGAPGAGTDAFEGTLAFSINTAGIVTGALRDANYAYHGFVRAATGKITEF